MAAATPGRAGAPPPRLMITEMVLENFKSYAGAQRVGPFHKARRRRRPPAPARQLPTPRPLPVLPAGRVAALKPPVLPAGALQ